MKKILSVITVVIIMCTLVGCGSKDIVAKYDELQIKYDELLIKYDEINSNYEKLDKLHDSYVELSEEWASKTDIVFEAFGKQISEESFTAVLGDVVVISVPYTTVEDALILIAPNITTLATTMAISDHTSCVILFVDDAGMCKFGFNVSKSGKVSYVLEQGRG